MESLPIVTAPGADWTVALGYELRHFQAWELAQLLAEAMQVNMRAASVIADPEVTDRMVLAAAKENLVASSNAAERLHYFLGIKLGAFE